MKKTFLILFVVCFVSGCGYLSYLKDPFVDIPQLIQVDERLYRGGAPNEEGVEYLHEAGVKTVISLQGKSDARDEIEAQATRLGMEYMTLPMSVYTRPTDDQILSFIDTVLTPAKQPVFVHCASGRDRTGTVVAVYRTVVYGWGPKEAYNEAKKYGFWPYKGDNVLKNYIHQLRDKELFYERAKELMDRYEITP